MNSKRRRNNRKVNRNNIILISSLFLVLIGVIVGGQIYSNHRLNSQSYSKSKSAQGDGNIVAWGDSLTYGVGGNGTSYPSVLSSLVGRSVTNYGVGGETSATIMGRQGSIPMMVQPTVTIPNDKTPVEVTLVSKDGEQVKPLLQAANEVKGLNPCYIDGIQGELSNNNGKYYFTREVVGNSKKIESAVPIQTNAMTNLNKDDVLLLWMGTNDIPSISDYNSFYDTLINKYKTMVNYNGTKKYIILSLIDGNESKWTTLNDKMSEAFGNHFINVHDYLVKNGLNDAKLAGTPQDTTDVSKGRVPVSLRSDSIHLNQYGYTLVGKQVGKRGQELGYW